MCLKTQNKKNTKIMGKRKHKKKSSNSSEDDSSSDESSSEDDKLDISQHDDCVYFTADVSARNNRRLTECLVKASRYYRKKHPDCNFRKDGCIKLFIDSGGGCTYAGLSSYDIIRNWSMPIWTIVQGRCFSAATFMLIAGHKSFMTSSSFLVIHGMTTYQSGWLSAKEIKDDVKTHKTLVDMQYKIYQNRTNLSRRDLDYLMDHDQIWNANKCKEKRIINDIW